MCIFLYSVLIRSHMALKENIKNPITVTENKIIIGTKAIPAKYIEKSVYNISKGYLYIYLKNGRKIRICKDSSKATYFSWGAHFSYIEYGKALRKLGIPFEVVRKKGLFGTEPVIGREAYREMRHKERYEKWLEKRVR